jgi:hypothetical protein
MISFQGGNVTYRSSYRTVVSLVALTGLTVGALAAQVVGVVAVNPAWLKVDSVSRTAEFSLTSGLTAANGGMNFNGSTAGALKLSVPVGWTVVLHFKNVDPGFPHSVEVIGAVAPLPTTPVAPIFAHAATGQLAQGMGAGGHQDVRFVADKAGAYTIFCPVPTHGLLGMWMRLEVSAGITRPTVTATKQGLP